MSEAPSTTSSSSCGGCRLAMLVVARLIALGTAAVSGYAILQVQDLLQDEASLDGGTLTMPVLLCMPAELQIPGVNGTTSLLDVIDENDDYECRSLRYMAQASMCALGLAALAALFYVLIDAAVRAGLGPFNRSSILGMALFSVFILFQAGYSTGAILQESRHWQDYYDDLLAAQQAQAKAAAEANPNSTSTTWTVTAQDGSTVEITEIDVYGDEFILTLAIGALFLTTLLMLMEVLTSLCCCSDNVDKAAGNDQQPHDLELKPTQSSLDVMGGSAAGAATASSTPSSQRDPFLSDQDAPTSGGNLSSYMGSSALSTNSTPTAPADMSQPPSWSNYH